MREKLKEAMPHKVRITSAGVWLDNFKVHGILEKNVELWKIKEGIYQPRLTLKIALAPLSELTIYPACNDANGDSGQNIESE